MIRYAYIGVTAFFLLPFFITPSLAQNDDLEFEHITGADGLPANTIGTIAQDYLGFIWLGTPNGLVKYDGYNMTVYKKKLDDSTCLIGNTVSTIYEDNTKNLWIGHSNGASLFERDKDLFKTYLYAPTNNNAYEGVSSIIQDHTGRIWICTSSNGLICLELDSTNNKREYKINKQYLNNPDDSTSIPLNTVGCAYESDGDILWFGGYFGLSRYNRESDNFTTYNIFKESTSSYPNRVHQIFQYNTSDIWFTTFGDSETYGILNPQTGSVEYVSLHNDDIDYFSEGMYGSSNCIAPGIVINNDGTFWIPSFGGGLVYYNYITGDFKSYINNPDNPKSLSYCLNLVHGLCKDYSGVLWVGTSFGGLNRLSKQNNSINHIKYSASGLNDLISQNIISQIFEDREGIIWLGTLNGGLTRFDRRSGKFINYQHNPANPNSLCDNRVSYILEDNEGFLWIATYFGLNRFDKKKDQFLNYQYTPGDTTGLPTNDPSCLAEDSEGNIYIGSGDGLLIKYLKNKNTFINYFQPQDHFSQTDTLGVIGMIVIDEEGYIWFSSGVNLNKFSPKKGLIKKYTFSEVFWEYNVSGLYYDSKGRFWMGRRAGGLLRFDKKTETHKIYLRKDGLPDESVGSILEDDQGNLWIRTGTSICKFNPNEESFRVIIQLDNYQNINPYAAFKSKMTGEMYFTGDDGFYIFHPDSIKDNPYPPKIALTDFRIFDESVQLGKESPLEKHINVAEKVTLNHWQNDFSIEFAALHFVDQKRNQYRYMLDGYDYDWRIGDVSRLANYTNMAPGDYLFRVIASNSDGIWNEEGASLKITILPPWWATTWAYIIYTLTVLSIIYFTWKLQLKRIRIKHDYEMSKFEAEKMHEVDEMKSRFFTNISHEFRTPLTLILGPVKDILEKAKDAELKQSAGVIRRNARRLYGLVNQLLDISKLEAGKMKLEASEQNIIPLLKGLVLSFTSLSERKKITLKFNTIEDNLNVYVDKDKLEKITNNLLSNAFKFTSEGGQIDFTVEKLVSDVEIRITDNGIGIAKERIDKIFDRFYQIDSSHTREGEGTGIGLALTKELVELHKGKIFVKSEEGEGTTFIVQLPLGKEHLKPEEIVEKEIQVVKSDTKEEMELVPELDNRKEKTEIDVLIDTEKPLLLIVEDNSDVRSYIISHLENDYRIQEAIDGEDGLNQAIKNIPDLIISDVMMPKMDGFELCNKLKTDERTSHIPIIMLTAKATSKDKIEGYETGADDYIMKPFDANELKVRIKNLIEIRRKLQEKFTSDDYYIPSELGLMDEQFMKRVLSVIDQHISEENFSIDELGREAAMSRMHLHRKLKALTGKSPSLFIRSVRLNKAKRLIKENRGTISEISYDLGFGSPAYFTKCFKEEFGYTPSDLSK